MSQNQPLPASGAAHLTLCRRAVVEEPRNPDALNRLGVALAQAGSWEEAGAVIARVIDLDPGNSLAHNNLGTVLRQLGREEEALASYERAIALAPAYAAAHNNRGVAQCRLGRYEEALASYDRALALQAANADAHYNKGNALTILRRYAQAVESYERAIALRPDHAEAHNNRGNALTQLHRFDEALESYERALALRPGCYEALNNRGTALLNLGHQAAAVAVYERLLLQHPQQAEAYNNLGIGMQGLQRYQEALTAYDRAISLRADYAEARWNKGMLKLLLGELREGWQLCEARWQVPAPQRRQPSFPQAPWLGSPALAGKIILLHAAEGFGDTIQFCRYVRQVRAAGARAILYVQPSLTALLGSLDEVEHVVGWGERVGPFDFHCPLMSLPLAFGTDLQNIPNEIPYLRADPLLIRHWSEELRGTAPLRVGIAWQGNPDAELRLARGRSVPLRHFGALAQVPGVSLVSLQKGAAADHLAQVEFGKQVLTLAGLDAGAQAFLDTAAVMMNLDLVVTCDTSIAHLAGALGVRAWVALQSTPDWRWLIERSDSPWYPTLRLFRQRQAGDWSAVFARIAAELRALVLERASGAGE